MVIVYKLRLELDVSTTCIILYSAGGIKDDTIFSEFCFVIYTGNDRISVRVRVRVYTHTHTHM